MKKTCKEKYAVRFFYKIMDPEEENKFKKHLTKCDKCNDYLNTLAELKKVTDSRIDKLPDYSTIKFPNLKKRKIIFKELIPALFNFKALRYGLVLSSILLFLFFLNTFVKKTDFQKKSYQAIKREAVPNKESQKKLNEKNIIVKKTEMFEKEQKWCFTAGGPLRSQPAVKDGFLYFGSDDKKIYSLDSKTGKLIWEYQTGGIVSSQPVIKDGFIYAASTDGYLYKFYYKTGELQWKNEIGRLVLSQIHLDDSNIYAANNQGEIIALGLDGAELWRKKLNLIIYSPITGDEKNIYFGTADGNIYSLTKNDGTMLWQYSTGNHFLSSKPLVIKDRLLIGDTSGSLYSFDKSNGQKKWEYKTGYQIITDPVCYNKKIYFASDKLYCLDKLGKAEWSYLTLAPIDMNFNICSDRISLIDKDNNIYFINIYNGLCIKKEKPEDKILSFAFACDKIIAGNRKGEICVIR